MQRKHLTIASRTERLIDVRDFVSAAARAFGFGDEDVSKIALAVDEACTNIIKHGYEFDPAQTIEIAVGAAGPAFEITITDSGRRFDPGVIPAPDMKEYLSHYRRGGLGVYLMRSLMDSVEYAFPPGHNEVRLVKRLPR